MAKVTVEELDAQTEADTTVDGEYEDVEDTPDFYVDSLREALELLRKSSTLMDYVSDPLLCKTISKRERDAMTRLSDKINDYCDEIVASLDSEEE